MKLGHGQDKVETLGSHQQGLDMVKWRLGAKLTQTSSICVIRPVEPENYQFYTCTRALKTVDTTIGNCQRPVFSLSVSQHMHKITNQWIIELNWSLACEIIKQSVCFQILGFETSKSNSEVSKSPLWKITTLLQKEMFFTMFYTISSSLLLITKLVFMLTISLTNNQ